MKTGLVLDPRLEDHRPPAGHPERPERLQALREALGATPAFVPLVPRPAPREALAWNHAPAYVERVARLAAAGGGYLSDGETFVGRASFEVARLAVGGCLQLVEAVMRGELDHGFALVRPPGHHAERERGLGFCLFNNVALCAHALRRVHGLERVAIVDWDVHHGNGTQHSFEDDPHVLYVSAHQWPHYPGTGAAEEVGRGPGAGFTVNLPLPAGCDDAAYLTLFQRLVLPILEAFAPQFVLVSAGFDPHVRDPLGGMRLSAVGFAGLAHLLLETARRQARGRIVFVLEGGYDLLALQESVLAVLEVLSGTAARHEPAGSPLAAELLARLVAIQKRYWPL